jgi:putative polyhydroxyalkanoate system protein
MPKLNIVRSHGKTLAEAKIKVKSLVDKTVEKYPRLIDKVDWNGDQTRAEVRGKMFEGFFEVDASKVLIKLELGLLAAPFMGSVQNKIERQIEQEFGPEPA